MAFLVHSLVSALQRRKYLNVLAVSSRHTDGPGLALVSGAMRTLIGFMTLLVFGAGAQSAQAAPIVFTDPDVAGMTITLENQGLLPSGSYDVRLTLSTDASYVDQGDAALTDILRTISFDVSDGLVATLSTFSTGVGTDWDVFNNSIQNNGNGNCGADLVNFGTCLQEDFDAATSANNAVLGPNTTFTWDLELDLLGGSFSTITSVKAFIADLALKCTPPTSSNCAWESANGAQGTTIFEDSANIRLTPGTTGTDPDPDPVPEPTSLVLLGSGLVLAASRIRRRR